MRVKGSDWTGKDIKQVKALWARRVRGEKTADLAGELNITPTHLSKIWRQFGMDPHKEALRQRVLKNSDTTYKVHAWRFHEGITYKECCVRLDMEPTTKNAHRLRNRHWRFCQRTRAPWPTEDADARHTTEARGVDLRRKGLSYRQIAPYMNVPPDDWKKVYGRLRRYCKNSNLPWPIPVNSQEAVGGEHAVDPLGDPSSTNP